MVQRLGLSMIAANHLPQYAAPSVAAVRFCPAKAFLKRYEDGLAVFETMTGLC